MAINSITVQGSFFGHFPSRTLTCLILLLFSFSFVSSSGLSVSPLNLTFDLSSEKKVCNVLSIFADSQTILIEDKWNAKPSNSKNPLDYTLSSEEVSLSVEYPREIFVKNKETLKICISSSSLQDARGVLLLHSSSIPAGVGIWIYVYNSPTSIYSSISLKSLIREVNLDISVVLSLVSSFSLVILLGLLIKLNAITKNKPLSKVNRLSSKQGLVYY